MKKTNNEKGKRKNWGRDREVEMKGKEGGSSVNKAAGGGSERRDRYSIARQHHTKGSFRMKLNKFQGDVSFSLPPFSNVSTNMHMCNRRG